MARDYKTTPINLSNSYKIYVEQIQLQTLSEINVKQLINKNKLDEITKFKYISWIIIFDGLDYIEIKSILQHKITHHILKYCVDLEYEVKYKWRPIHYICCYSTPEMIKYIIEKGVDLECENNSKSRP